MNMKSLILAISVPALAGLAAPVSADGTMRPSEGSANVFEASEVMAVGSTAVITGSGELLVAGIQAAGDVVIVTLRGASEAGTASVKVSQHVAAATSLAVGTAVQVTAESAGYAL